MTMIDVPPRVIRENETSIVKRCVIALNRITGVRAMKSPTGKSPLPCQPCREHLCPRCAVRFRRPFAYGHGEGAVDIEGILTFGGPASCDPRWSHLEPVALAFGIEVKTPTGRTKPERARIQAAWRAVADRRGMPCAVVHHQDGAVQFVRASVIPRTIGRLFSLVRCLA